MDSQNRHAADGFLQADGTGNLKWYREGDTLYIEVIGKLERNLYWLKNASKVVILPGCTAIGKKHSRGGSVWKKL